MMDQYKNETSQIHAPADLIRRTKEAVREEEQRILRETMQPEPVAKPKRSYAKVYRWALPVVAAAAVCLVVFNLSVMRFGRSMNESATSTPMDTASGAADSGGMEFQLGALDTAEDAAAADEPIDKGEGSIMDMTQGAAAETAVAEAAEEYAEDNSDADGYAEATASAEDNGYSDSAYEETEKKQENSYIDSIYGSRLWIEKVDEAPSFYEGRGTEHITVHGVNIYVAQDTDGTWIAYARKSAQRYLISGELTENDIDREAFAKEAYELLMETIGNAE